MALRSLKNFEFVTYTQLKANDRYCLLIHAPMMRKTSTKKFAKILREKESNYYF